MDKYTALIIAIGIKNLFSSKILKKQAFLNEFDLFKTLISTIDQKGMSFLINPYSEKQTLKAVQELVEVFCAPVNRPATLAPAIEHRYATPLGAAIDCKLISVVKYLIIKGADLTYTCNKKTLLEYMNGAFFANNLSFLLDFLNLEISETNFENNNNNEDENSDSDETSNIQWSFDSPIAGEDSLIDF